MNKKMHLIMPMAGGGTRFGDQGFFEPKPLIELQDHPFFFWAVQSIIRNIEVKDITFVVLQDHVDRFQIDQRIHKYYSDSHIVVIPEVLNGAVLTCLKGMVTIQDDLPLMFNDCDHAFRCRSFEQFCMAGEFESPDGALLTFKSSEDKYSYVQYDSNNLICGTVEKRAISKDAICGAYYFKNKKIFEDNAKEYLTQCCYREFFMSGIYNVMAKKRNIIDTFHVDWHISFGTPEEYSQVLHVKQVEELK